MSLLLQQAFPLLLLKVLWAHKMFRQVGVSVPQQEVLLLLKGHP